jgi:glycosyltransferase involved in cell wall biosynthesis
MPKTNRIILDCSTMNTFGSGLYYYCLNLGKNLGQVAAPEKKQLAIEMFVPKSAANAFDNNSTVHIKQHGLRKFFNNVQIGCSIWHHTFQADKLLAKKWLHPSLKVVSTIHDLNVLHEDIDEEKKNETLKRIQLNINKSEALVCISDFCRKDVEKHCQLNGQKIFTIHNGVNHIPKGALSSAAYKPIRPFLLCIGFANPKKNFHSIIPLLTDEKLELIIIGKIQDNSYQQKTMDVATQWGVQDRVRFTGLVTDEEKGWYLENCYAFLQPSLAEGFGFPVVEAMQLGKPLFLSTYTSLPEVGGSEAFYFNDFSLDTLQQTFYEGMQTYQQTNLAEKLKERAKQFSWQQKAALYLDMYKTLL